MTTIHDHGSSDATLLGLLHQLGERAPAAPGSGHVRHRLARRRVRRITIGSVIAATLLAGLTALVLTPTGVPADAIANTPTPDPAPSPTPEPAPEQVIAPSPQDAPPIAALSPTMSVPDLRGAIRRWLDAIGADSACILRLPGQEISLSIHGSSRPVRQLAAEAAALLRHYDLVDVRLHAGALTCSLSRFN
ncbi:MAG: hypothetical protein AB7K09_17030 [Planctomycetota bacterium]